MVGGRLQNLGDSVIHRPQWKTPLQTFGLGGLGSHSWESGGGELTPFGLQCCHCPSSARGPHVHVRVGFGVLSHGLGALELCFTVTGAGGAKKGFRAFSMCLEGVVWNLGTFGVL